MLLAKSATAGFDIGRLSTAQQVRVGLLPNLVIRAVFYGFVFSLPFETTQIRFGGLALAQLLGLLLVGVIFAVKLLHQPRLPLDVNSKALTCFGIYLVVYAVLGVYSTVTYPQDTKQLDMLIQGLKTLTQLVALFWISYNLFRYDRVIKGALSTLALGCVGVALLQVSGLASSVAAQERVTAFEANPNSIAAVLSIGLILLLGLAYGRSKTHWLMKAGFWVCFGIVAIGLVNTGSRGPALSLAIAVPLFALNKKDVKFKLKIGVVGLFALGVLIWASYSIVAVRERWERSFYEHDTAGRDKIFSAAWDMFTEKPVIGWGPSHVSELGARVGWRGGRDTHNDYLWLLTETGLSGAVPFLVGLGMCWLYAWRARSGVQGALPAALMALIILLGTSGTNHFEKLFWILLAYAFAAGKFFSPESARLAKQRYLRVVSSRQPYDVGARKKNTPFRWMRHSPARYR